MTTTRLSPSALVVIDMQAGFFYDPGLAKHRDKLVSRCNLAASRAHSAGALVVEVRTVHSPDKSSWSLNMLEDDSGMAIEGTPGAGPVDGLDLGDSVVVEKTRDSAFHGTRLADVLADHGVRSVAMCGVSTESCVAMTAADAYAHDLRVVLVEDAVAAADDHAHRHALDRLRTQYRQPTVRTEELEMTGATPPRRPAGPGW
jgi:nicotinamidase-related amidase